MRPIAWVSSGLLCVGLLFELIVAQEPPSSHGVAGKFTRIATREV